jgi:two-component system sporulation sensor kinase B
LIYLSNFDKVKSVVFNATDSKEAFPLQYIYNITLQLAIVIVPTISIILWKQGEAFKSSEKWITISIASIVIFLGNFYVNDQLHKQLVDYAYLPIVLALLSFGKRYGLTLLLISIVFSRIVTGEFLSTESIIRIILILFLCIYIIVNKIHSKLPKDQNTIVIRMLLYAYLIRILLLLIMDSHLLQGLNVYSLVVSPVSEMLMILLLMRLQQTQFEVMRRKQNDAQTEKQKLVSELAASIAHEIRNPITVVKGFLQLISDPTMTITKEKRDQYFELCLSELERAEFIIKDYLSFSKPNVEHVEKVVINSSIDKIVSIVQSYSNLNNIHLDVEYDRTSNITVHALKTKIDQILLNIVKNAIEACTGNVHPVVKIVTEKYEDMIRISIQDNGPGMDQSIIDNIGTAYQTTKVTGTGLGMMVTKKLIEEMKGKLAVSSSKENGCRIDIMIPIVE